MREREMYVMLCYDVECVVLTELMKKVSSMVEGGGEMVLKYQLVPEDLDALVSVRTEEDVKHMIEEHDRHHTGALLRAFLFPPSKQTGLVACEPYLLEQRYIDAINGIIRASPRKGSACSSPKSNSPDASPRFSNSNSLHRVQSSPTLTDLGVFLDHQHQGQQQQYHHPNFHFSRPPQDPQRLGGGRVPSFNYHHYSNITRQLTHRGDRGGGYAYYDDSPPSYAHDRIHSVSRSPRRKSIWE